MTLPQIPIRLGRAEIALLSVFQLSEGRCKANMSWIFLKIPPGNLLEICLIKFIDTLY